MPAVEAAHAVVGGEAHRRLARAGRAAADQVAQRVAAEGVAAEQDDVGGQHQGADADAEGGLAGGRIGEPQRLPHVVGEEDQEDQRQVEEVAVDVLEDQRERALAAVASCAAPRRCSDGGSAQNAL